MPNYSYKVIKEIDKCTCICIVGRLLWCKRIKTPNIPLKQIINYFYAGNSICFFWGLHHTTLLLTGFISYNAVWFYCLHNYLSYVGHLVCGLLCEEQWPNISW